MQIFIANNGDTFRKIAKQFHLEIEDLLLHNPSIMSPDENVGGLQISLPTVSFGLTEQLLNSMLIPIGKELPEFSGAVKKLVFGGATLFWGAVSPRMANSEIQNWPISLQEMDYYYNAAEWIMKVNKEFSKGSSLTEVLLGRLHRMGLIKATAKPWQLTWNKRNTE